MSASSRRIPAVLGSLLVVFVMSGGSAPVVAAQPLPVPRTLTVSGEGEVKAVPDEAQLTAGVVSQAPTAQAALDINRRAMDAVFASLKQQGIPDKSIQTSQFAVLPQYDTQGGSAPRIVSYQVSNNVSVTVDDLSRLGPTIDALVGSGANSMGSISFMMHDPKTLMQQAREAAVKDATDRAQTYARTAGLTLGRILKIEDGGSSTPRPFVRTMAVMAQPATPIAAGEESITANVSMTFEIR